MFRKVFKSELYRVRPVIIEAMAYVKRTFPNITRQDEIDLRLIFSELLFNAVIHGNKNDGAKIVAIEIAEEGGAVRCLISDEGAGFDHAGVIEGFSLEDNLYSEHGRGIYLARRLSDEFYYNESGNEVYAAKRITCYG